MTVVNNNVSLTLSAFLSGLLPQPVDRTGAHTDSQIAALGSNSKIAALSLSMSMMIYIMQLRMWQSVPTHHSLMMEQTTMSTL